MKSRKQITPPAAAALAAAVLATTTPALAAVRTWDGGGNNNNLPQAGNWDNNTVPDFQDAAASPQTDSLVFNGNNNGKTTINLPNNQANPYTVRSITFDATAPSFTFSNNQGQAWNLGDSTSAAPSSVPDAAAGNTGAITNNGASTHTFNNQVRFRFGRIDAAGGGLTFGNQGIDVGNGAATADRDLLVTGAFNTTVNGPISGLGDESSAGGALSKSGAGLLTLNGDSSAWNGRIAINDGAVRVGNSGGLGSAVGSTAIAGGSSTARLELNGTTGISVAERIGVGGKAAAGLAQLRNVAGGNVLSGALTLDAGGSEYALVSDAGRLAITGGLSYGTASGPSTLRLGGAGDGLIAGPVGAGGNAITVIKEGTGTWTLDGPDAYTGGTTVAAGRLNVTTARTAAGAVAVGDGAALGVRVAGAGQSLNASSLTIGSSAGGATLAVDFGAAASPTAAPLATPALSVNGSNTVTVRGGLAVGTFPVVDYAGTIGGSSGFAGLVLGTLPARVAATLADDAANSRVLLNVTAYDLPKWTGAADGNWDLDDGTGTGTANWREVNSGAATKYLQTPAGSDAVLFDDTPGVPTVVNLTTTLSPAAVTVDASANAYTLAGPGALTGGGGLTKSGTSTLTIANTGANDFTGTTTVSGGTLRIGDGATAGAGQLGAGPVVNNAAVVVDRPDAVTLAGEISGAGSLSLVNATGVVTLSGNNSFSGPVAVSGGTLKLGNNNALGSGAAGTTVAAGAALDFNGRATSAAEVITVSGAGPGGLGALLNTGSGSIAVGARRVVFAGDTTVGGTARFDVRDNPGGLDAAGFALTKVGTNNVFLADLGETHLGDVDINGARLAFEGDTTFGDRPGTIRVNAGGELGLEASTASLTKPVEAGGGTIRATSGSTNNLAGPVTLNADTTVITAANTTLTVGGPVGGAGTLLKQTGGTLILSGNNAYGATTHAAGTLRVGADGATGTLGGGPVTLAPAAGDTATLQFRRGDATLVVGNTITSQAGGANVVAVGANNGVTPPSAVVTLSGTNTFTGAVNVNGGSLRITNSSALGAGPKTVTIASNGKPGLRLDGSSGPIVLANDLTLVTSNDDATYPAIVSEAGHNVINGPVTPNNGGGGNTRVSVAAGTLTLAGNVSPAASATSARTLILDGAGNGTVSGAIAGGSQLLGVTKEGTGTWTLAGVNTYTGTTVVRGGTLVVAAGSSLGTGGAVNVAAGTLDVSAAGGLSILSGRTLRGRGTVVGGTAVGAAGVVAPGDAGADPAAVGTLTLGALSLAAGSSVVIDLTDDDAGPGTGWDAVAIAGGLAVAAESASPVTLALVSRDALGTAAAAPADFDPLAAGSWVVATAASFDGAVTASQFVVDPSQFQPAPDPAAWGVSVAANTVSLTYAPVAVPEPTAALAASGLAGLLLHRRRRRGR